MGSKVGTAAFRTQLQKRINDQWHVVDDNVQSKIEGYFAALSDQVGHFGNQIIHAEKKSLDSRFAAADTLANSGISDLEKFQRQLDKIAE